MEKKIEFEQVIERGCGIDVHKSLLVATIRGTGIKKETREYAAFERVVERCFIPKVSIRELRDLTRLQAKINRTDNSKLTAHHRFMLETIKESIKEKEMLITKLDKRIEEHLNLSKLEVDKDLLSNIPNERDLSSWQIRQSGWSTRKKRALIAVGHKILIAAYFILKEKKPYKELGGEFLINRKKATFAYCKMLFTKQI
jgi:hypothetical protein